MVYGRPVGSGKYGEKSYSKTFRLTWACAEWITQHGGREYLEDLVPKKYRKVVMKPGDSPLVDNLTEQKDDENVEKSE